MVKERMLHGLGPSECSEACCVPLTLAYSGIFYVHIKTYILSVDKGAFYAMSALKYWSSLCFLSSP